MTNQLIQPIVAHDLHTILDFTSNVFVNHEPMCKCLDLTPSEFRFLLKETIEACCELGYSFCTRDDSNNITSVILSLPYLVYQSISFDQKMMTPSMMALLTILDNLSGESTHDDSLYVFIIAAKPGTKGLAKRLLQHTVSNATEYTSIIADSTNCISQHIFVNPFGFEKQNEIVYKDFNMQNTKWFQHISCTPSVFRAIKQQNIKVHVHVREAIQR